MPPEANDRIPLQRRRKKILFVSNSNEFGGAEKHLLELVNRLRGPGVQLCILCLDMDLFAERLGSGNVVEIISCKKTPEDLRDWIALFRSIRPDTVVFIYGWFWAFPWVAVVGAWRAGIRRRFSIQHLLTAPWPVPENFRRAWEHRKSMRRRLARFLGREPREKPAWMTGMPLCVPASLSTPLQMRLSGYLCNTTICVSDDLRHRLVKDFGFPAWKTTTVHNGVSVAEFVPSEGRGSELRRELGLAQDDFILVCVARLSEQKGIDLLIQGMACVAREGVRSGCLIVGDGPLREQLVGQARRLGVSDHIRFVGFQKDVRSYLQAGSAFILTSHREGLPLSILEAMACGLPSIVTDVGGNAEVISDRVHGLIVRQRSVQAVAEAISYLATHPRERLEMGRRARQRVCEAFDIDEAMARIQQVILN